MEIPLTIHDSLCEQRTIFMSSDSGERVKELALKSIDFLLDSILELDRIEYDNRA